MLGDSNPNRGMTTYALGTSNLGLRRRRESGGHALDYQFRDFNHAHCEAAGGAKGFHRLMARMMGEVATEGVCPPDVH